MMLTLSAALAFQLANTPAQDLDLLHNRVTPVVRVVQKAAPSVVYITTSQTRTVPGNFFQPPKEVTQGGSGSGVVVNENGYLVTNYHVIEGADEGSLRVSFDPKYDEGRIYPAEVISFFPQEDLALLKITGEEPFDKVRMGTSSDLMIGERVVAIGNPYGQTHTVSTGIISGLHRDIGVKAATGRQLLFSNLIQTDASINFGNSGGPLLNINGELIGINTVVNAQAENIGYAIPVDRVRKVLNEHLLSPALARAWFGFKLDLEDLRVVSVTSGSPAAEAGIQVGDRLSSLAGQDILGSDDYRYKRLALSPGEPSAMSFRRKGQRIDVSMVGWDRVSGLLFDRMGLTVEQIRTRVGIYRIERLRVIGTRPEGPAHSLGLQPGDLINIVTAETGDALYAQNSFDLALFIDQLKPETSLQLEIWRDDNRNGYFDRTKEISEIYNGTLKLE